MILIARLINQIDAAMSKPSVISLTFALALIFCGNNAHSQDRQLFGEGASCLSGDCVSGTGTIATFGGHKYTGRWTNGRPNGSVYKVEWPDAPGKTFELAIDSNGRPIKGTVPRGGDSVFSGTFKQSTNPFTKSVMSTYDRGTYSYGPYRYEGQFDFLPELQKKGDTFGRLELRGSSDNLQIGRFVFIGARIDESSDEVVRGIFASEAVIPGMGIHFFRATPGHLMRLREQLVSDKEVLAQEEREAQAAARSRSDMWLQLFQVAAGVAVAYGEYKLQESAQRAALSSISDATTGKRTPESATRALIADVPSFDKSGKLVYSQQQLREIGQRGSRTTVAEYRAAQSGSTNVGGGAIGSVAAAPSTPVGQSTVGSGRADAYGGTVAKSEEARSSANSGAGTGISQLAKPAAVIAQTSAACSRIEGVKPPKQPERSDYFERVPVAGGNGKVCWSRELALSFVKTDTDTKAMAACHAKGAGWTAEMPARSPGYVQCNSCEYGQVTCEVDPSKAASYDCFDGNRYSEDKRAFDRYARDAQQCQKDRSGG